MRLMSPPFTDDQVTQFIERGYVYLREAFAPELAAQARDILWETELEPNGIQELDSSTWVPRHGIRQVFNPDNDGPPWYHMFTDRMAAAIDQLAGAGRWDEQAFGFGWWVVSFPFKEGTGPWHPTGTWHIDGAHFKHYLHSGEQGLLPIILFSDIEPEGGGTALLPGSHKHLAQYLCEEYLNHGYDCKGFSSAELLEVLRERKPSVFETPVEVVGKAGDVCFTHPLLVHSRSSNLSPQGASGIRFICNPCVRMFRDLNLNRSVEGSHSPVELVSRQVLLEMDGAQPATKKKRIDASSDEIDVMQSDIR